MKRMSVESWTAWAAEDARRRGLPAVAPLIEGLAAATARLRATSWQPAPDSLHGGAPATDAAADPGAGDER